MTVFCGVCALSVDWGRTQLAKTEMIRAVDAAARAATQYLPSDPTGARDIAISVAAMNTVDGKPLTLTTSDIVIGRWNSTTSTIDTSSSSPDTVKITGYRTSSRNGQIPLSFARVFGITGVNLSFSATAQSGAVTYGIVGLSSFNMNNANVFTGTYDSSTGTRTVGAASSDGSIACNSTFNLNNNASVGGTIYYYSGSSPGGAKDYDAKTQMSGAIATPATPSAGSYTTSNDNGTLGLPTSGANANIGSGTYTVAGGHYVVNSFSMTGGTITFTGPATIYVYGNFSMSGGTLNTYQNKPSNLKIEICASAGVNLSQTTDIYAQINAPTSPLNISGSGDLLGSVVASSISMAGSAGIYYDIQLGPNGGPARDSSMLR